MTKPELRSAMRSALAAIAPAARQSRSARACATLAGLPEFQSASRVFLYLATPQEADTTELALAAWRLGKTVLAPRVDWQARSMSAVEIRSLFDDIVVDARGLREPSGGDPCPLDTIDLIVVPGLAFDSSGNRLGRGGGFYDRLLAAAERRAIACGLALAEQIVPAVPTAPHDVPVDIVVTDQLTLRSR